ncbi:hypothetical protein TIFTF001_009153 [Ficus carica]|uniref:Uncharacterized protein n=1 Tax=Ficus carica TaxID=3494 RepID=A0AA87ZUS9_FICCA|nr:hypothetical protein TIFTF001_009153 [Ficus carica]
MGFGSTLEVRWEAGGGGPHWVLGVGGRFELGNGMGEGAHWVLGSDLGAGSNALHISLPIPLNSDIATDNGANS